MERNWAGNLTYSSAGIVAPASVAEVQRLVADHPRVRALGSRHSFNDVADTTGVHVSVAALPPEVEVDGDTVTVSAGTRYGVLADTLDARGLALPNLASLPHISVAGAVATGTHGSGVRNGCLSTSVAALEVVGADGSLRRITRSSTEFAGSVVALGALGVVVRVTLDVLPTFGVRQVVYPDVPWEPVLAELNTVLACGYSVSLFTDWTGQFQVWVKSTDTPPPAELYGAGPSPVPLHMIDGESVEAVTEQGGVLGAWLDRLPHFRLGHKPSSGEELQSEYLVPRDRAVEALNRVHAMADRVAPVLHVTEIRSIAADDLWLSGGYGQHAVALHFTWHRNQSEVFALLPDIEAALLPLGARPHWGKCFAATARDLAPLYPKWTDFAELRHRYDPHGKFGNAYLDRVLG